MSGKFWTDAWSLVDGCTPISEGCRNCWLARMEHWKGAKVEKGISGSLAEGTAVGYEQHTPSPFTDGSGAFTGMIRLRDDRLDKPLRARKPRVYAIWSDLFHEDVHDDFIKMVLYICAIALQHTILIVTKRAERAARFAKKMGHCDLFGDSWARRAMKNPVFKKIFKENRLTTAPPTPNVWLLVTMENQQRADERMPYLLRWPGKRGVIIEPCLGGVDLRIPHRPSIDRTDLKAPHAYQERFEPLIHQVILGPENGPRKRPFDIKWKESVEAQCEAADVPFYYKATGEGKLAWRE